MTKKIDEKIKLPTDKELTLRVIPMPKDTNYGGSIFGGYIFSQIDLAASLPAIKRAKGRVATVAVNSIVLHQAVYVGDVLSLYAYVSKLVELLSRLMLRFMPNAMQLIHKWLKSRRHN